VAGVVNAKKKGGREGGRERETISLPACGCRGVVQLSVDFLEAEIFFLLYHMHMVFFGG
jgi:hypothetical protein